MIEGENLISFGSANELLNIYSNLLIAGIAVIALLFGIFYRSFFRVVTTVGRGVSAAISSVFLVFLNASISLSTSPTHAWYELPPADPWWHQMLRALIYTYVAWKFAKLMHIVVVRRFWPERLEHARPVNGDTLQLTPRRRKAKK